MNISCPSRPMAVLACSLLAMTATASHPQEAAASSSRTEQLQQQLGEQARQIESPTQPATDTSQRTVCVGSAPPQKRQPPPIAPLFDQPGILTPKGKFVLEPSLQYVYSSSNRLELQARLPYVYRSDATISREIFTGSASDNAFNNSGNAMGDVELAARYQFNDGSANWPNFLGSLRFKSRTGKDPFEVVTDCVTRCMGNTTATGLPLNLPTGSGFYSLQPGVTFLFQSDPAVFFGGVSYTHNFKRSNVSRVVLNGERESIGSVEPVGVLGVNFDMGLALNDKSSLSMGV